MDTVFLVFNIILGLGIAGACLWALGYIMYHVLQEPKYQLFAGMVIAMLVAIYFQKPEAIGLIIVTGIFCVWKFEINID